MSEQQEDSELYQLQEAVFKMAEMLECVQFCTMSQDAYVLDAQRWIQKRDDMLSELRIKGVI